MIKNWAPWLDVLWVNVFELFKSSSSKRLESLSVSDLAFIASGIFTEGSVIHISEQVWWQCLKI